MPPHAEEHWLCRPQASDLEILGLDQDAMNLGTVEFRRYAMGMLFEPAFIELQVMKALLMLGSPSFIRTRLSRSIRK
jgi:hypothetical protein